MISMKLSPTESKDAVSCEPKPGDGPAYPYGLCLYLNTETLGKLGFTDPPAVGSELVLHAKVVVTSVGMDQQQDGDKQQRADLQITDMELASAPTGAAAMYGQSKMNP
jgi:hypothetical protein